MINPMDMRGKHILVTGASSGIGKQTCILLSQLGARVSLVARSEEKLSDTLADLNNSNHMIWPFDVTDISSIEGLVSNIVSTGGKLDGFVHSAGIGTTRPLNQTKFPFLDNMMKIHFFSFVEFSRVIAKKVNSNDQASIVAVSSATTICTDKGKTGYSSTKGALDAVVRPLAIEIGTSRHFRFNTVNPGWVKTEMYEKSINEFGKEHMDEITKGQVLGLAEPREVALTIVFLLSDASSIITGQNLFLDGGLTIH